MVAKRATTDGASASPPPRKGLASKRQFSRKASFAANANRCAGAVAENVVKRDVRNRGRRRPVSSKGSGWRVKRFRRKPPPTQRSILSNPDRASTAKDAAGVDAAAGATGMNKEKALKGARNVRSRPHLPRSRAVPTSPR